MSTDTRGILGGLGLGKLSADIGRTLLRRIAVIVLGVGITVLLARVLGPSGNGIYAIAILLPNILTKSLELGVGAAAVYFVGRGAITTRQALLSILRAWSILSIGGAAIGTAVITLWGGRFEQVQAVLLWAGIAVFPLLLLRSFLTSLLQAVQDFRRYNLALLVGPAVTLPLVAIAVWGLEGGVPGAMLAFGMGQVAALIAIWHAVQHHIDWSDPGGRSKDVTKDLLSYGWKVHVSNVLSFLNYRADLLLVTLYAGAAATGIYVIAVRIAERLWLLSQAVSTVVFPRLSELHRDEAARKALTPLIGRWVLMATSAGSLLLALVSEPLIDLLFGSEYIGAAAALIWLLPGIVLLGVSRVLANDIAARGRPGLNTIVACFTVAINISANIVLIPHFGIKGAAMATTISYGLNTVAKLFLHVRLSGNAWWRVFLVNRQDWQLVQKAAGRIVGG